MSRNLRGKTQIVLQAPNTSWGGARQWGVGGGDIELGSSCVHRAKSEVTSFPLLVLLLKGEVTSLPHLAQAIVWREKCRVLCQICPDDDSPAPSPCLSHKMTIACG